MPLTEISPNFSRPGSHSQSLRSSRKGPPSTNAAPLLAPAGVQRMLRTATETGEIGQFSVRPSRLPRSGSRIPATRRRSGSFDSSLPPGLSRHRPRWPRSPAQVRSGPRQTPSFSTLSRQDTIRSNLTSYRNNARARAHSARQYPLGIEGRTNTPGGPPSLYSHRSLVTLRSQGGFSNISSNSPVGHAGPLRRPGHRPTSPAYSDAYSHGYSLRPHYHRSASVGTATSSPVSRFARPAGMPVYHPHLNSSVTSFVRLPSPAIQPPYHGFRRSPFPTRTNTPVSVATKGLQRSPTGTTIPQYYDYTESFAEDCMASNNNVSAPPFLYDLDQTILENEPTSNRRRAQTPFGTMSGSAFHPAELPTIHNRTISDQSKYSCVIDSPNRASGRQCSERPKVLEATDQKVLRVGSPSAAAAASVSPEEDGPRRTSVTSRRTCSSSPSSAFFPNASRSARDLSSLAARVHSPGPSDNSHQNVGLDSTVSRSDGKSGNVESKRPDWQLPSLQFRPLSFTGYAQSNTERPKSAEGVKTISTTEILSPTPERPVSSQRRRRFSKILGIEEDHQTIASTVSRSCNSLNFVKLKRVVELPESTYPARFSIPAYSPRKSTIGEGTDEDDIKDDGPRDTASSQATDNARSTVELLLDNHIQCLGLQPEALNGDSNTEDHHEAKAESTTASGTESTLKLLNHRKQHWHENSRPRTASSAFQSTLASPERELLVPKKLFSNKLYPIAHTGSPRLTSTRSLPCMSATTSPTRTTNRPSTGWHTLASTSQLFSPLQSGHDVEAILGQSLQEQFPDPRKYKVRRRAGVTLSPTSSSFRSQDLTNNYDCDDSTALRKKWRNDYLAEQALERRKIRLRLKLKRNSRSLDQLGNSETSTRNQTNSHTDSGHTNAEEVVLTEHLRDMSQYVELLADEPRTLTLPAIDQASGCNTTTIYGRKTSGSPDIPHRWSSIVAIAPEVVRPDMEIRRLTSIRTARSQVSNASLAEPINSTRLSAQIRRISHQTPQLPAPDLAPSLGSLNLDVSARYPDVIAGPRPILRETRSFFSDDSSAVHKHRGSLRDRFHFHNLRSVLPSSPRATMVSDGLDMTPRSNTSKPHQLRRSRRHSGDEEERGLYGTVGMTDFAYRKRKVVDKLKDWWRKHSMQMKLGLKRRKSCKNFARREGNNPSGSVMI